MFYIVTVNVLLVTAVVLIHYEFLSRITAWLPKAGIKHRYRVLVGVGGALVAHAVEVWLFGAAYYVMVNRLGWGEFNATFSGNYNGTLMDCVYFSFTVYTTLGFGDIQPLGDVRYLTGIEALTGLVLITWTASFLYLEMQRYWRRPG
ncbi:potassium channel family protein [Alloalcanivorax gelatiniphagus]|uniref:Two pore domain potassium channel family protein n=1 Tax=Alloalcanivorax gelatiniphagus TaxID=1194167 RepID=A0ABY2XJ82_9GAMM|nr:potassium channel family protein [Alloalcanivorax gelatiniphagus]TMW11089.1 two pore domain potassium channel family protein [Alloalcanivorax gelatiniphagus]